jgi:translocation and assembly module TamB
VAEPQGGVLGRLLDLPQRSDFRVALNGEGPLDAWQGTMNATLDGRPLADLTAEIAGRDVRTIAFNLRSAPDPLLPENVRPLIAGGIDAKGTLGLKPGGASIQVTDFSARSAAGSVTASGVLGLSEPGDLAANITVADSRVFATLVPDVAWSGATLQARLQGTINAPRVTADLDARILPRRIFASAPAKLNPGCLGRAGFEQPVGIRADLTLSSLASSDPRVDSLLAGGVRLNLAGSLDQAGTLVADQIDLQRRDSRCAARRGRRTGAPRRARPMRRSPSPTLPQSARPSDFTGKGAADIALKLDTRTAGADGKHPRSDAWAADRRPVAGAHRQPCR